MSLAHFSDILRFNLLNQFGGGWIDATCFLSEPLPKEIEDYSFYSIKGAFDFGLRWQWTSFFMFAQKGNILVDNMCRFYDVYWKEHNEAITYLILDCWVTVLKLHVPAIAKEIDILPHQGTKLFNLISHIQDEYTSEHYQEVIESTFVYKLTYKDKWNEEKNGKQTIFGHLIENYK